MSDRWRTTAAGTVALGLLVALGYAMRPAETSPRKVLGEVVGLELYAGLDRPPIFRHRSTAKDREAALGDEGA